MKEFFASGMFGVTASLERLDVLIAEWEDPIGHKYSPADVVAVKLRKHLTKVYHAVVDAARIIDTPVTGLAAGRAEERMKAHKTPLTFGELKSLNGELKSRFEDELSGVKFYCLKKGADAFYKPNEPLFGKVVAARISGATDDVAEAGKCFAVGRYTASVFHLMRAMEVAVQALSADVGVSDVDREWGKLLSDLHTKIEAMPKGEKRNDWSRVHANLYHVKQAWRNDTMHPKATYTEEEAREVFDATKSFMRHLAGLLPPTAEEVIG